MQDQQLTPTTAFPAPSGTAYSQAIDLSLLTPTVSPGGFSPENSWRLGRLRVSWPKMPNRTNTDPTNSIFTFTLQSATVATVTAGTGATATVGTYVTANQAASTQGTAYANTNPLIQAITPVGVASTGAVAGFVDLPLPPLTPGPVRVSCVAGSAVGDETALSFTVGWLWE
jgi:hypothetical protein